MNQRLKTGLAITVVVMVFAACSQPEVETPQEEAKPAVMENGPDPVSVDSGHYKAEFENDRVRVLRITYGPGEESVMHYHPDNVGVFLRDQQAEFTLPDGSTEKVEIKGGTQIFAPAGQHLPKNIGEGPIEVVLVELKGAGGAGGGETGPDPAEVDSDHYKVEFENDKVRVLRITYGPGEESVMHYHPDNVAVFLRDQQVEFTLPDGSTEQTEVTAGTQIFAPAGQHLPKNIGEGPVELVLVELKD